MFLNKNVFLLLICILGFSFISAEITDYAYILKVDSYSTYPQIIYPNSEVSLNVTLTNISQTKDATDVYVKLINDNELVDIIKDHDYLKVIKFDQSATSVLRFKIKENTPGGYYTIPFLITYNNGDNEYNIESQVTIYITNYSKLNIVLDEYPKENVYLNDEIIINGKIKNEGNTSLKGISVVLNYSTTLIPLSETTLFLKDVLPNESKDFNFYFKIPKTAEPGIYDLNIYSYDVDSHYDIEKLSLVIEDKPNLIISSIDKSIDYGKDFLSQGDKFSLSIQLENISKSKAKSGYIKLLNLEELNITGTDISYIGVIDAEDTSSGVFDLILGNTPVGNNHLKFEATYLDEYDIEHSFIGEIPLLVSKAPSKLGSIIFTIIFLGIIAGIIYYVYNKKIKKNKIKNLK